MRTLWARAAQVRCTCNCLACSSVSNPGARRTTTSVFRRGLRRPDGFVVFSSTLAVSAAFIDTANKDARSQEWSRVIGEAKAQIETVEADQQHRLEALAAREGDASDMWDGKFHKVGRRARGSDYWTWVLNWAAKQDQERALLGFNDWRGPPLDQLKKLDQSEFEKLMNDDRIFRRFYGGPDCQNLHPGPPSLPLSAKKRKTMEWSVQRLVLRLLLYTPRTCEPGIEKPEESIAPVKTQSHEEANWRADLAHARARLNDLHYFDVEPKNYEHFESPKWPQYPRDCSLGQSYVSTQMNVGLHALLQSPGPRANLHSVVKEICRKLLFSSTPPNIHTYNLLLVRFCQLKLAHLVRAVFVSMQETHIRPNEITHATILRFFTIQSDYAAFRQYVLQMDGLAGGLALAHPERAISYLSRDRYHYFGIGKRKIAEKARMNAEVYSALIVGTLQFFGRDSAMYYYCCMVREGWKPTNELMTSILKDCSKELDFVSGYRVWQVLQQNSEVVSEVAYREMLRLCRRCNQDVIFGQILHLGIQQGVLSSMMLESPEDLLSDDTHGRLQAPECKGNFEELRELPRKIRRKLENPCNQPLRQIACDIIRDFPEGEERQAKVSALFKESSEALKLLKFGARIGKVVEEIEEKIFELTKQVNAIVSRGQTCRLQYSLSTKIKYLNENTKRGLTATAYMEFQETISSKPLPDLPHLGATHAEIQSRKPIPQVDLISARHPPNPDLSMCR